MSIVLLRAVGCGSLWFLSISKMSYLWNGGLGIAVRVGIGYYALLVSVTSLEFILGALFLRRPRGGRVGEAVVVLGLGMSAVTIIEHGSRQSGCGCLGRIHLDYSSRLAMAAWVLLLGGLRVAISSKSKNPTQPIGDRAMMKSLWIVGLVLGIA